MPIPDTIKPLISGVALVLVFMGALLSAQQDQRTISPSTGNPTPGTPQPEPPVLADRVAVTGCVIRVSEAGGGPSAFGDTRFVLTNVKKEGRVPAGTGTSAIAKSPLAARYRLAAIDSFIIPFVGARVQLSGEIVQPSEGKGDTLLVAFIQRTTGKCS